jgi:hypothetical protein
MAQVAENLPIKYKALSSSPSTAPPPKHPPTKKVLRDPCTLATKNERQTL